MNDFGSDAVSRRHLLIGAATLAVLDVVAPRRSAANSATVGAAGVPTTPTVLPQILSEGTILEAIEGL